MKKSSFFLLILAILLAFSLAACERSATTPPAEEGDFPVPEGTRSAMDELSDLATQTAMPESVSGGEEGTSDSGGEADQPAADEGGEQSGGESEAEGDGEEADQSTESDGEEADTGGGTSPEDDPEVGGGVVDVTTSADDYDAPSTYELKAGEFPFCIARRFDVDVNALLSASGLSSGSYYYAGTKLTIPSDAPAFNNGPRQLRTHPATYVVRSGDSLNSIACLFGDVDPRRIADENNLGAGAALSAGQELVIP